MNIDDFSDEVIVHIFRFTPGDLISNSQVSKRWRTITLENSLIQLFLDHFRFNHDPPRTKLDFHIHGIRRSHILISTKGKISVVDLLISLINKKNQHFLFSLAKKVFSTMNSSDLESCSEEKITTLLSSHASILTQEKVSLSDFNLLEIPPIIGSFKEIKELTLSRNQLEFVPREIFSLFNLESLHLQQNLIKALPQEISQLVNLKTLSVQDNQLEDLPKEIGQCTHLQTLLLGKNRLKMIPSEISECHELRILCLGTNLLETIPEEILQLSSLHWCDILPNPLKDKNLSAPKPDLSILLAGYYERNRRPRTQSTPTKKSWL